MKSTFVVTTAMLASTSEAKLGFGACPKVNFMNNLDMDAYSGTWYTVKRDDAKNPMYMSRCPMKTVENLGNSNGQIHAQAWSGKSTGYKHFDADVVECGQHENSTCMVTNKKWKNKKYPYTLLATDYESYDVYYFCYPFAYNSMNF
jgi:lipocalin